MSRGGARAKPKPQETPAPTEAAMRQAMREHAHLIATRKRTDPATGNQLWRLNSLGILGPLMRSKEAAYEAAGSPATDVNAGEVDTSMYVTMEEASALLDLAKQDGLW